MTIANPIYDTVRKADGKMIRNILTAMSMTLSLAASESKNGYVGTYPGDAAVEAYADQVWDTFTNKLEANMTMKWVHYGIIQPTQAYTDIRRTGFPTLTYPTDNTAQVVKNLPNRIKWPNSELANNAVNFNAAVAAQTNEYTTKLFWAK